MRRKSSFFYRAFSPLQASFCIGIPEYPRSGYNRGVNAFLGSTNCDFGITCLLLYLRIIFLLISASAGLVHYSDSSDAVRRRFTGRRNAVRYRTLPRAAPHRRWDAGIPCAERRRRAYVCRPSLRSRRLSRRRMCLSCERRECPCARVRLSA